MHWRVVFSRSFSLVSSTQFSCMCTNVKYTYIFVDMFSYVHLLCFFIYSIMYLFCLFIYVCVWYTSICTCSPHVPAHAPKTLLFQLQCLTINPSWSYDIYIYRSVSTSIRLLDGRPFSQLPGKIDGATRAKLLKELDTHDDAKLHAALATCLGCWIRWEPGQRSMIHHHFPIRFPTKSCLCISP